MHACAVVAGNQVNTAPRRSHPETSTSEPVGARGQPLPGAAGETPRLAQPETPLVVTWTSLPALWPLALILWFSQRVSGLLNN